MKKRRFRRIRLFMMVVISICCLNMPIYGADGNSASEQPVDSSIDIPILMYHHLSNNPEDLGNGIISQEKFKEDMLYLKVLGFETILFKDLVDYVDGVKTLPDNPILITFDDGYLSNYEIAYPVLKELEMKATISVIGWSVGRTTYMDNETPITPHFTWEQAKEMYESGLVDIQHHTYDLHKPGLGVKQLQGENNEVYKERFIQDTLKLKSEIEEYVGNEVFVFTYPLGVYNDLTETEIKNLGYRVSLTINKGINQLSDNLFLMKRLSMGLSSSSPEQMEEMLGLMGKDIDVPFKNIEDSKERIKQLEIVLSNRKINEALQRVMFNLN